MLVTRLAAVWVCSHAFVRRLCRLPLSQCRLLSWRVDLGASDLGVCCPRLRLPSCWDTHSLLGLAQFREGTALSGVISSEGGSTGAARTPYLGTTCGEGRLEGREQVHAFAWEPGL